MAAGDPIDMQAPAARSHTAFDDVQAIVTGSLFVALGVTLFGKAGLLAGGTAGLAFLVHYATGWHFGPIFFVINLPFYGLALRAMGWMFTLKTFAAIACVSLFVELMPRVLRFELLHPLFAGITGGFLIGAGLLMLFRHKASLGGLNVVVLYLQNRRGWGAGKVQMLIDTVIVLAATTLVDVRLLAISVLGAVALNLVVAINHRPGRYLGV